MNSIARFHDGVEGLALPSTRTGLSRYLSRLAGNVGADAYMLFEVARDGAADEARILASNWIYDTIRAVGVDMIQRIAHAPQTVFMSVEPRLWRPSNEVSGRSFISAGEAEALEAGGHVEIASARIKAGGLCYCIIFSAQRPRSIGATGLPAACVALSYALCTLAANEPAVALRSPVSERERECLAWVSEGKTTDEVAVILGVSSNTVNSYVTAAIQKLSARNRAMAIATAIRAGII
jgi:DNA-binding CsgD family transcriptional regulator